MKIDVRQIVSDHVKTLVDHNTGRMPFSDFLVFLFIPVGAGILAYASKVPLDRDVYNVTITFFGIFIALLLNVQVAIFSIFQRRWSLPTDVKALARFNDRAEERKHLLSELNSNLSYLTLFCCVALVEFFCFFVFKNTTPIAVGFFSATLFHFLTTLLMTIKRSHILFSKEYSTV
jgi:hypothetical protein